MERLDSVVEIEKQIHHIMKDACPPFLDTIPRLIKLVKSTRSFFDSYIIAHMVHAVMQQTDTGDWHAMMLHFLYNLAKEQDITTVTTNCGVTYRTDFTYWWVRD